MGIKSNQLSSALGLKGETPANRPGASAANDIRYNLEKGTEINNSPLNVESDNLQGSKYNQAKPYTNPEG
jgi:hypothetical protein|tara:strand:+ start:227 stop:436 length:210 start_codon:yes stop_codon:yes gene_type:complete